VQFLSSAVLTTSQKTPHETAAVWNQFKARPQSKELSISLTVDQTSVKGTKET